MSKTEIGIILTADGRMAQASLAQVEQGLARMGTQGAQATKQLQQGIDRANNSLSDFVGHAARLTLVTQGISGIASALNALPKAAFDYTKNLETSAVGMAGIMASVTALNGKQLEYNQALGVSQDMIRKLGDDALRTAASSQELVGAFQALLAPGLAAGMKLDEIRQLTTVGTNAVKSIGLQGTQVVQELRDLVAGGITASSSTLATALGLKDADIAKAKASAQGLFAFLMERLKGFESSSEAFGQTLQGRMDTLKEGATRVAADGMKPLTDEISRTVGAMGQLLVTFDGAGKATINPELVNGLRGVSEGLVAAMNAGKAVVGVLYEHRDAVGTLAAAYAALKLGGMVSDWTRATTAKIELMQASRLAAAQAAVEGASNTALTLTSRQKTAALLAELQANVQKTAAQAAATVGTAAAIQAEQAHANAVRQLTVAQDAASVSGRAMGAVIGALGGPVGIAITALTGLAFWIGSVSQKAESAANLALKYQRASGAAAQGKVAEAGDIAAMQAYANQLREVRDSSLQAGDAIRTFRNAKGELTYAKGSQMDPLIAKVEADIKAVTAASEKAGQAQGQLTLTLTGAKQAWEASVGGIKTASSVQDDYAQKLGASQRAYQEYRAVLVATGADQASISAAATKQAQAEKALVKERDAALKSLNKTTGNASAASRDYARAVDAGLASLQARTTEELIYSAALAQHGTEADKMLSGEREVLKLRNELTIATAGLAQATTKDGRSKIETRIATLNLHMAEAVRLADVQRQNQITKESLELGQKAINDLQKQADAIRDKTAALAEENAAYGQINPTLAKALAQGKELAGQMVMTDGSVMDYERAQRAAEAWALMNGYIDQLMQQDWNKINGAVQEWQRSATEQAKLYEDEARLSGLSALERAKVVAARQVELKLAKQIAEIEQAKFSEDPAQDAAKRAQLIADATTAAQTESSAAVAKVVQEDWTRTSEKIEEVLIDALMDGGKSGTEYIEDLFRTMVLRPVLQAIVSPVAGAVTSALGFSGSAQAGQSGGGLGGLSSLNTAYSAITTGIRSSIASGFEKLVGNSVGEKLGLSYSYGDGNTYQMSKLGEQFSGVAQGLGSAMTAYGLQKSLSGGYKTGASGLVDAAAAIGGFFDPTGGLIAGAIGGAVNRAFGRKLKDQGLEGTFGGADGFDGSSYEFYKGGWFRSDKTKRKALDSGVEDALETQFKALQIQTALMAQTLGLGVDSVADFTSKIKVSFNGLSEEQISQRMAEEFGKVGEAMAQAALGQTEYARTGETAVETLTRLSSSLTTVNGTFDVLGQKLLDTSLAGADMASQLVDLMGGLESFTATTASYLQNFYTEAERTDIATRQLTEALADAGINAMPATRDAFRALVEAQDITTDSGRETYAALLGLNGAFAELVPATDDLTDALEETHAAIKGVFQELRDAIQGALDDVQSAFDTINGPKTLRDFAQITTAAAAVDVTAPSSASVTTAKSALEQARSKPQYLVGAESYAEYWANLQAGTQTAFESAQQRAAQTQGAVDARWQDVWNWSGGDRGSWQTYRDQINAGTWWERDSDFAGDYGKSFQDWYNETTQLQGIANEAGLARTNAASVNDSAIAQKSEAQASANTANAAWQSSITAAQYALTAAENDYFNSLTGWIGTAKVSVETLGALKDETLAYYEAQQQLADGMRQSAANLRAAAQEAMRQTLSTDTALGLRLSDFDRAYTLALSTSGADKAGYADQMAAALPQLAQDIAAQSSSRVDWQVAVAKLANQSSTVAAQLEAQAPVNLQAEANRVLGLIDGKLADINAASVSAEQVISAAVNAGTERTATGLQNIVKALQGETATAQFYTGGYTGPGGKYEAAGVVHRGEVVFSQDDIARLGGVRAVEAIRTGEMPGYATGGTVGAPVVVPAPAIPGRVAMAPRPAAAPATDPEQQEREAQARDQAQRDAQQQTQDLIQQLRQVNSSLTDLKRSVDKSGQANDQMNNKLYNTADTTLKLLRKFDSLGLPVVDVTPVQAATEAV